MSYVLQFFIAAVATVTFAILFAAPKKELVFCGVSGGLAWLVYFILYRQSGNVVLGSLVATFVLTILSRILAVARCNPATDRCDCLLLTSRRIGCIQRAKRVLQRSADLLHDRRILFPYSGVYKDSVSL